MRKLYVMFAADKLLFASPAARMAPISFGYCEDCLSKNLEPYSAVVAYIACAGHFPDEINKAYQHDVRRMLPLWNKTEEEFIRDVDAAIKEMEGFK